MTDFNQIKVETDLVISKFLHIFFYIPGIPQKVNIYIRQPTEYSGYTIRSYFGNDGLNRVIDTVYGWNKYTPGAPYYIRDTIIGRYNITFGILPCPQNGTLDLKLTLYKRNTRRVVSTKKYLVLTSIEYAMFKNKVKEN